MKARFCFLAWMLVIAVLPSVASAGRAEPFRGWYEIQSGAIVDPAHPGQKQYMVLDNDTLERIWAKYSKEPLPADLDSLKNESTVFIAFTDRTSLFLTLEKNVIIGPDFISIRGVQTNQLEMKRAGDGSYDAAMLDGNSLVRLHLAAPVPSPESN